MFALFKVFDNTPAAKDGTLESGDEIVGVNGTNVKVSSAFAPWNKVWPCYDSTVCPGSSVPT